MTRVGVASASGRPRLVLEDGALSPRVLAATDTGARIALVATRALLLGGDHVVVDIDVGPDAWLRIDENAGTVAYDAGGVTSSWIVHARVSAGGALSWFGQPFVVADRAAVSRELIVDLAPGGTAVVRDTLVLGRSGERGGALRTRTRVRHDDTALHAEDLDLVNEADRGAPGLVGTFRVLDTLAAYGFRPPPDDPPPRTVRFDLHGPGAILRRLAADTANPALEAPLAAWAQHAIHITGAPEHPGASGTMAG